MTNLRGRILIAASLAFLGASFGHGNDTVGIEFFEAKVRPLLVEHCFDCHAGDHAKGGLLLDSPEAMARGGDSGSVFKPHDPEASLLIRAVRYQDRDLQMPPKNRLSDAEIAVLEKWIEMGAPDPRSEAAVTTKPTGMRHRRATSFLVLPPGCRSGRTATAR